MAMSGKEIYERKKRLRAERLLRQEEDLVEQRDRDDEVDFLVSSLAASFERIADALEALSQKQK